MINLKNEIKDHYSSETYPTCKHMALNLKQMPPDNPYHYSLFNLIYKNNTSKIFKLFSRSVSSSSSNSTVFGSDAKLLGSILKVYYCIITSDSCVSGKRQWRLDSLLRLTI